MSLDYLKFVEDHNSYENYNVFEKVMMAVKRTKDIYEMEKAYQQEDEKEKRKNKSKSIPHKPTFRAILEINEKKLKVYYPTEEELAASTQEQLEAQKPPPDNETVLSE